MKKNTNKRKNLWSGRFEGLSDIVFLNASINFDKKLYEADIKLLFATQNAS